MTRKPTDTPAAAIAPRQHDALLAFFSAPKDRYTAADLAPLFDEQLIELIMDGEATASRSSVHSHISGFVPASHVGAAAAEAAPDSPLVTAPVTYHLPRWIIATLEERAGSTGKSASDYLAEALLDHFEMDAPFAGGGER